MKKVCYYILIVFIWVLLSLTQVHAKYSKIYDKELYLLSVNQPEEGIKQALIKKQKAEQENNNDQQLIALLYMARSYDVLSNNKLKSETIDQGLKLAAEQGNNQFKSEFLILFAFHQELKGEFKEAATSANQALILARKTKDNRLIAECLALRGQIQNDVENYELALKDIEAALSIFKANDDKINLSLNYNLLAIVYYAMDDFDGAIKYYNESEKFDEIKSPYNLAALYYNIGATYVSKNNLTQALNYYEKSKKLSELTHDINSLAFVNYGMAEIYLAKNETLKAKENLLLAMKVFQLNNDFLMVYNSHILLADIYISIHAFEKALEVLNIAEIQMGSIGTVSSKLYFYSQKIDYFKTRNNWEQAYYLKIKMSMEKKKLTDSEKETLLTELKIKYNAQFDQEKLALLQAQNNLQLNTINQEKTIQKYLWGLVLLGFVIIVFIYFGYKNQRTIKRHLYQLSITDYLTNVANRRHIIEHLKSLHKEHQLTQMTFVIIMIDLDNFKNINDQYGHDIGNEVLVYFANIAKRVLANKGTIGRVGGEEWLVLMPKSDRKNAKKMLKELRKAFKESISIKIPKDCLLTFSSGVMVSSDHRSHYSEIMRNVDQALYQAKEQGKDRDVFV